MTLKSIFQRHQGKVSDKWLSYLDEWETLFVPFRDQEINLFEIGVHNGGSLEIWAKYFSRAKNLIGCDVNEACGQLQFSDPRIAVITGDVNSDDVEGELTALTNDLDILIDDGSHHASDIIHAFARYFKYLNPGGVYIIEDLHTSYWQAFNGGLHSPYSAMGFLKHLSDLVNFEHWRNNSSRKRFLSPYETKYRVNFDETDLWSIHAVTFINSLCVIQKKTPENNLLGRRIVVGSKEEVSEGYRKFNGASIHDFSYEIQADANLGHFYLLDHAEKIDAQLQEYEEQIRALNQAIDALNRTNQDLAIKLTDQIILIQENQQVIETLNAKLLASDQLLAKNNRIIEEKTTQLNRTTDELNAQKKLVEEIRNLNEDQRLLIQDLGDKVEVQGKQIHSLNENLSLKDADLQDREQLIDRLKGGLLEREEEILSYALDPSWRITRPLRKIEKLFRSGWPPKISLKDIFKNRTSLKQLHQYFRIQRTGLFDFEYYLKHYPDVRKSNMNPLMHFIKYGWKEGRNPSALFRTSQYLDIHPEINATGINPLLHYLKNGYKKDAVLSFYDIQDHHIRTIDLSSADAQSAAIFHQVQSPPRLPDIIVLPIIDWDFRFQRPQQLATQFAKLGHRVFYIQMAFRYQDHPAPLISPIQKNIYSVKLSIDDRFANIRTFLTPENTEGLAESFRILREHFLINAAVLKVDSPLWSKIAICLKTKFSWHLSYDCMDLHRGFSNNSLSIDINEKNLIEASDSIFVSSQYLADHILEQGKEAVMVPNGTDFKFFARASDLMLLAELAEIPKPIIGYYGAIADWFDSALVSRLAAEHPEWSFVLVGSTYSADLEPLKGLPNIYLLGEKPYASIPAYLSHFAVCLIPFKNIPLTQATNPVKLYEYLSAGKPVVATNIQELTLFEEQIRLASTPKQWETAILASLEEREASSLIKQRQQFAQNNTWGKRAAAMLAQLGQTFPNISLIILSHNNWEYTRRCLESIENNTSYPNYEIILVDNGSNEDTIQQLKSLPAQDGKIKLIFNRQNLGFAKAANQAVGSAGGDYLLFLNNDTIVTPGWLHRLLTHLNNHPKAGMVGPVTNAIGNEAKIDISYKDLSEINTFSAQRAKQYAGQTFKIPVLALYCAMISKTLFEDLGGLDERYELALFEDDDLAMKLSQRGLDLICAEDVFVHHFHGATIKLMDDAAYQRLFDENKSRFEQKWGIQWTPHQYRLEKEQPGS